jgi:predicted DNA-binding transcriptional regulator YafY
MTGDDLELAQRDLAALRARGLSIHGEAGPGGGVRLEGDRGITAVDLTTGEVVTLWLTARLSLPPECAWQPLAGGSVR